MWLRSRFLSFGAILALAFIVSACGFHLRGAGDVVPWPRSLDPLRLEGTAKTSDALKIELARLLEERHRVSIVSNPKVPVLKITQEHYTLSTLSLSLSGKTSEYMLTLRVVVQVNDGSGKVLIPGTTIQVQRSFLYDSKEVLAMDAEEQRLRTAMVHDVALGVLRRIAAQYGRRTS
jgi:LPS-assembly lipoprotein